MLQAPYEKAKSEREDVCLCLWAIVRVVIFLISPPLCSLFVWRAKVLALAYPLNK
jgi:hypothetical protein